MTSSRWNSKGLESLPVRMQPSPCHCPRAPRPPRPRRRSLVPRLSHAPARKESLASFEGFLVFFERTLNDVMRDCHVTNTRFHSGFPVLHFVHTHMYIPYSQLHSSWKNHPILMATVSPCCFLCSASLGFPTKRRVISPVSKVNADIHEFLVTVVRPGHQFGSKVAYVCRMPCFSNLTTAVKHHVTLRDLMLSFGRLFMLISRPPLQMPAHRQTIP